MKKTILILALTTLAAQASLITNQSFESGNTGVTTSGNGVSTPSSLTGWNQWANSGPVNTQKSSTHDLVGNYSAHITGGLNDGIYQYGNFSAGFYTASAWFWVSNGAGELGLFYNGGTSGAFSSISTKTGTWEYISTTNFLGAGPNGAVIYTAAPNSNIYVDAFYFNAGQTSTSPYNPANGFSPFSDDDANERETFLKPKTTSAVPEPGTWALMGLGLFAIWFSLSRRIKLSEGIV